MSSDDTNTPDQAPDLPEQTTLPDPQESKASPNYSLAAAWVQGGTRTSLHDKEFAERKADAERRRNELDSQRKLASIPISQGGAKMYNTNFTDTYHPRVIIRYGEMEILCELVKDDISGDWLLTLTCPECVKSGAPEDSAQFHIRQGHRNWHIDTRDAGKPLTYEDTDFCSGRKFKGICVSAGVIKDTDTFRCPNVWCGGVRYQIDNNIMRRVYR